MRTMASTASLGMSFRDVQCITEGSHFLCFPNKGVKQFNSVHVTEMSFNEASVKTSCKNKGIPNAPWQYVDKQNRATAFYLQLFWPVLNAISSLIIF